MNSSEDAAVQDRSPLLGTAAVRVAAASASSLLPLLLSATPEGDGIRPFRFEVSEEQLAELRRRVAVSRWPARPRRMPSTSSFRPCRAAAFRAT